MQKAAAAAASGKRIHEVVLPKLFKWYKDDFGFSKQEILVRALVPVLFPFPSFPTQSSILYPSP